MIEYIILWNFIIYSHIIFSPKIVIMLSTTEPRKKMELERVLFL